MPLHAYLLLAAMLACAALAMVTTAWAVVPLLLLAGVWLLVNSPFEGPVLVTLVRHRHGITAADLVSAVAVAVAVVALLIRR